MAASSAAVTEDCARLVNALPKNAYFDEGLRGYLLSTARREYWRVSQLCDLSELVQDGVMIGFKCYQRYVSPRTDLTGSKDDRKWFQAIVKTAYMNHISSLAAKHKGVSVLPASDFADEEGEDIFERCGVASSELSTLGAMIAQAPWELLQLVRLLAGDGTAALGFQRKGRGRETTNEYYCRLLGVDPTERDLVGELRTYFD